MIKYILLTGHSKGLGKSIAEKLLTQPDFHIVGISRTSAGFNSTNFTEILADLSDVQQVFNLQHQLKKYSFHTILLNAGANSIKPPESYKLQEIQNIIQLNFTSNALILRMCLNSILQNKGHIIGIGSYSGLEIKKWNNFYGAAKSGLHHLLRNLFEQYRKQGIKVSIVIPDIMNSEFYKHQEFEPVEDAQYSLQVNDIAELICSWIIQPPTYVPFEIILRPQQFQLKKK
ncbi:MAG: hypothetical protein KatS3mg027_1017 [Bacteroidia bacterium]|nr:MAG: hypothetical protein KatS3mg027_1017 [Bacteroidia bacterium]